MENVNTSRKDRIVFGEKEMKYIVIQIIEDYVISMEDEPIEFNEVAVITEAVLLT